MFRIIFAAALLCEPSIEFAETCIASPYGVGHGYHGKRTASGAFFNTYVTPLHRGGGAETFNFSCWGVTSRVRSSD